MDHRPPSVKVEKPWGNFEQYTHNLTSTVKIITVAPAATLSRQYHHHRDELWVVLDAGARVELDGEVLHPEPGEKLFIPRETVHRLSAVGERDRCGYWRSPSASSTRRTSSASTTSTAARGRDGPSASRALRVSLGGGGEPRREPGETPGASSPASGALRDGRSRLSPLLLLFAALLLVLLAVAGLLLWSSLGDSLSGTSVARDSIDSGPEPQRAPHQRRRPGAA